MRLLAHTPSILVLALALVVGCSEMDLSESTDSGFAPEDDTAVDMDTDAEPVDASWASLSGTVTIASSAPDLTASQLTWRFYDGELTEACAFTAPLSGLVDTTPPADVALLTWWTATLDTTNDDGSCTYPRPTELRLGLGALPAKLYPAMDAAALDESTSALYGLYAQLVWQDAVTADTPVWVFGVAGTSDSYDGSTPAVSEGPLPDGTYTLQPLHLFPAP